MRLAAAFACVLALVAAPAFAQTPAPTTPATTPPAPEPPGTVLVTVVFKHDQSKPLPQINAELKRNGFYDRFPPAGAQVVSWYVMMGLGQVATFRIPADRVRDFNRTVEETAWGGYRTEVYLTYNYRALAEEARQKNRSR